MKLLTKAEIDLGCCDSSCKRYHNNPPNICRICGMEDNFPVYSVNGDGPFWGISTICASCDDSHNFIMED